MTETTLRGYHEVTKHRPGRPSTNPHRLEWRNQPDLFKRYPGLAGERPPENYGRVLRLGAGVHPRRGDPHFRTFMSAGALHPLELYVAARGGLSHYHPGEDALRRLRAEDPRPALGEAAAAPELSHAGYILALTGVLWRTAWKYGPRGWRHIFWDAGAMLANLLALTAESDPRLLTAFVDAEVSGILVVDPPREAPVALLAVGADEPAPAPIRLAPITHESPALSPREHRFPEAEEAQAASSLPEAEAVRDWRRKAERLGTAFRIGEPPSRLEEVILRRGSARDFTPDAVNGEELASVLAWTSARVPGDLPPVCSTFVVAHAVDGLEPGVYRFDPPDHFETVRTGAERRVTAHVCLDQPLGGRSAATVFFTADLDQVLSTLGGRGYRIAQLAAGLAAGRASLGAYGHGLGATGLTFYDDEVRQFLATEEEPMMCLAVGVDARRSRLRTGHARA